MKKKWIIAGLSCIFMVITGILYSCAYQNSKSAGLLTASGEEDNPVTEEITADVPGTDDPDSGSLAGQLPGPDGEQEIPVIYVHICGAVQNPGVYQVEETARLVDLITLSGGLTEEAAGDYINQAEKLADGQRVYVPSGEELQDLSLDEYLAGEQGNTDKEAASALVNINTADVQELMELPGIGQAKAESIIAYRSANGSFLAAEDLMKIPGIKEGLFSRIALLVTVE